MRPLFHPTFGSRPAQILGREELIEAGIIESPRKGIQEFAVPYLSEYLRTDKYSR